LFLVIAPLWACPAPDDGGGAMSTGSSGDDPTTTALSITVTTASTSDPTSTTATTTIDPDSGSSTTNPTTGSTTRGTATSTGGDSSTGSELCEIMIPPPGECPFAAPRPGRGLVGAASSVFDLDPELDLEAQPDEVQGGGFIIEADVGGAMECDIWTQDCPDGEKCMPWANDGGGSWNATRCSPLDPNPAGVGEDCNVEGSGVSGIDNCDIGQMCWGVDAATNIGYCLELCSCDPSFPVCNTPNTICSITNDGVLPLCLLACNPLDPTACPADEACYGVDDGFQCVPDNSGDSGAPGDPCSFINACDPGSFCASADGVPGCDGGSPGCCSPFCTLGDDATCLADQGCVPWFAQGGAPDECLATVGACVL